MSIPPPPDDPERDRVEYWRAATLAVPAGAAVGLAFFAIFAVIADSNYPDTDPSFWVLAVGAVAALCVSAIATGTIRRTPWTRGVATGLFASAMLIAFVSLVLR